MSKKTPPNWIGGGHHSGRPRSYWPWIAPAWVLAAAVLALMPVRAVAQENDDCFTCHADKDLSKKRDGRTVSLFVDQTKFAGAAHGKIACVGCHGGVMPSQHAPKARKRQPEHSAHPQATKNLG